MSTENSEFKLTASILKGDEKKLDLGKILFDLRQRLVAVNHKILLTELQVLGIQGTRGQ